jgi:RNA polymerase sigma-70 factor (ECF subfamily)
MGRSNGFFVEVGEPVLARARRGDRAAIEELYRVFSVPVYTLACRLSASRADGEEILQETFLELIRSIGAYRGEGAFGAWLRRIVVTKSLMRFRRDRVRRLEQLPAAEDLAREPAGTPSSTWISRCDLERSLARLSDTARTVVWLHDVEGMTHREIGRVFHRSESFSKSQLSRAHQRLRRLLNDEGSVEHASRHGRTAGLAGR